MVGMNLRSEVVQVTPDMAREYLARNHSNRRVGKTAVRALTGAINRGEWKLTHQGLAFDEDDNLIDGQHRLLAIIAADKAVPMMITTGLPRSTFTALDQGHRRQAGQVIDVPNPHLSAAIARRSMQVEAPGLPRGEITVQMVVDYLDTYPEIIDAAAHAAHLNQSRRLTGSIIGTVLLHALVSPFQSFVKDWVEELNDGVGLTATSPSRHLINRFTRQTSRQIGERVSHALMAKAWNAYALRLPMSQLKVSATEDVPAIVGFTSRWELRRESPAA